MKRVNIGCGMTPTVGWINFDNSFSVRLAKYRLLALILYKWGLISPTQMDYITFCQNNNVRWADATRKIPLPNNSTDAVYSSHMLEHMDREEAVQFLREVYRILTSGGVIRIAVPDLERLVKSYTDNGDADPFIESTHMCVPRPRSLAQRLRFLVVGPRQHQWMYDARSLSGLLVRTGFSGVKVMPAGQTIIINSTPLDLYERADESVYVEGTKP